MEMEASSVWRNHTGNILSVRRGRIDTCVLQVRGCLDLEELFDETLEQHRRTFFEELLSTHHALEVPAAAYHRVQFHEVDGVQEEHAKLSAHQKRIVGLRKRTESVQM